jgi:hypothetical protein
MLASDGGEALWVENKVTFDGVRWFCVWRDVSAAKKAEARAGQLGGSVCEQTMLGLR